jgi:uncharacterized protein (DUF934 family)
MPLLKDGLPIEDGFTHVADGDALPDVGGAIVSLERWKAEREALIGRNTPVGVKLTPGTQASDIAGDLEHLALIAIPFPKFRDGRAFTVLRALRERYGYTGEVRAVGHIIADQYLFLHRLGLTTVEVPADDDLATWKKALGEFTVAYQPSILPSTPLNALRRGIDHAVS